MMRTLALLLVAGCAGSVAPPPPVAVSPEAFWLSYWRSAVEVTSYYAEHPRGARASLSVSADDGREWKAMGRGTGVVIAVEGEALGILTAKHVVEGAGEVAVSREDAGGLEHRATAAVVMMRPGVDLALLSVHDAGLAALVESVPVGSGLPEVGSRLWCVGNALGVGLVVSTGVLSADSGTVVGGERYFRGSYQAVPGNSGSGVYYDGRVVGIVSAILMDPGRGQLYPHLGLFVGPEEIAAFLRGPR